MAIFSLFNFPRVPRKKVLELFDPIDLLELSLLSKESKVAIRNCTIKVRILSYHPRAISVFFTCEDKALKLDFNQTNPLNETRIINNAVLQMWSKNGDTISCLPKNFHEDILNVFRYFQDLFLVNGYQYQLHGFTRSFVDNTMGHLPKRVSSLQLGDDVNDDEVVQEVLEHLNVDSQMVVMATVTRIHEKMNNLDHLFIRRIAGLTGADLCALNCNSLHIWFADELVNADFNTLLRHWKVNKSQMESFRIGKHKAPTTLDLHSILVGLNAKPWNEGRRSGNFLMDDGIEIDCTKYMDIERNGLLASFGFTSNYVEFVVWKKRFPVRVVEVNAEEIK